MVLTLDNLHHYLLDKGKLSPGSITDGSYAATQSRTRNTTFTVTQQTGSPLFVKQLAAFDQQNSYILQKDATCLWLIHNEPSFAKLRSFVPDYYGYDAENQVLITAFIPEARNMEMFLRIENGTWEPHADFLAQMLAACHIPLSESLLGLPSMRFFPRQIPWIMNLGVPHTGSQPAGSPVMQAVTSSPDFMAMLRDARAQYDYTSLIHGDLKWMNLLIYGPPGAERLSLIDWEIADLGDPMWDIAAMIMSAICLEVAESPYQTRDMSQFPTHNPIQALEPCWPPVRALWQAYLLHAGLPEASSGAMLRKALHFAGVRLIQTAVEYNMNMTQLNPNSARLLQACIALFSHRDHILSQLETPSTTHP